MTPAVSSDATRVGEHRALTLESANFILRGYGSGRIGLQWHDSTADDILKRPVPNCVTGDRNRLIFMRADLKRACCDHT